MFSFVANKLTEVNTNESNVNVYDEPAGTVRPGLLHT